MKRKAKVRINGLTDIDNICRLLFLEPDYMGFVFIPDSPRCVAGKINPDILSIIPDNVRRSGTFANASQLEIRDAIKTYGLNMVELHGNEKPRVCAQIKNLGVDLIKAFDITDEHDFENVWEYTEIVDYFLFNIRPSDLANPSSGLDLQLILRQPLRTPWILGGCVSTDSIVEAAQSGASIIDLDIAFESSEGIIDYNKLRDALSQIES